MRMMDELKPLYLYSSDKKVYAPIDEKDKRRGSAILLLTPNTDLSSRLMNLPYLYNPQLFNSFYIDRNVMAYIDQVGEDIIDFDAEEEESLSEASLIHWTKKTKISFKDGTSMMDKRYVEEVFNYKNLVSWSKKLILNRVPEEINIIVHPTAIDLQKDAPKTLMNLYKNRLFSYTKDNEVHLISKLAYDENTMGGPYEMYLTSELIYTLLICYNSELHYIPCKAIGVALSGLINWKKENEDHQIQKIDSIDKLAKVVSNMEKKNQIREISKYAKTGNVRIFTRYMASVIASDMYKILFESELSYFERQKLLPGDFGIPDKRKYPMPDEEHVRLAIRFFNNCDPDDEEKLAADIIRRINRFGIKDVKISAANRFRKYFIEAKEKGKIKTEAVVLESFCNSDYEDVLRICSHLSKDEFNKISFYDTYRDSPFIIKRFIHRVGPDPAGFLDVYHFPSKKEIAQITIAVDPRFRGQGVANSLVREMLNANLPEKHGFNVYQWRAHPDNYASMCVATKNGFNDTGVMDKYGRKVFILVNKNADNVWNVLKKEITPTSNDSYSVTESHIATNDFVLINEANDKTYSQRMRKYLYEERLRNTKAVLNLYDKVKSENPVIKRTYSNIKLYKRFNLFVDLSYYNGLFLKNNNLKLDKAVEFYFEFMNRLINNKEIDTEYKMKTIFIPVDADAFIQNPLEVDITDYKRSLNPISVIFRLARTNIPLLKREWGNKRIIFVGSRGYFTIDFNKFEFKDLSRVRINLRKLMSVNEVIKDDFERDELGEDENSSSSRAITANVVSKIEKGTGVKIDNISSISNTNNNGDITSSHEHLKISSNKIAIDKNLISEDNGVAIISIDPDGPDGFKRLQGSLLSMASKINNYCIPEK